MERPSARRGQLVPDARRRGVSAACVRPRRSSQARALGNRVRSCAIHVAPRQSGHGQPTRDRAGGDEVADWPADPVRRRRRARRGRPSSRTIAARPSSKGECTVASGLIERGPAGASPTPAEDTPPVGVDGLPRSLSGALGRADARPREPARAHPRRGAAARPAPESAGADRPRGRASGARADRGRAGSGARHPRRRGRPRLRSLPSRRQRGRAPRRDGARAAGRPPRRRGARRHDRPDDARGTGTTVVVHLLGRDAPTARAAASRPSRSPR
jgi:hypothetical protein